MRLRLSVRRNGIPEVKLLWTTDTTPDYTVSRLLAALNDVVPLESGEWGLEDYAVEYKDVQGHGFECLHFQVVADILKEDDEVLIRPLLESDIRRRRLSGRHQISIDGRHLVDGISFGRPWVRAPVNRPAIELPPRKRARITYGTSDEDEDEDEGEDAELGWEPDYEASDEDVDDEGGAELFDESEEDERLLLENGDASSKPDGELSRKADDYIRARHNRRRVRPEDDGQATEDEVDNDIRDSEVGQYLSDSEDDDVSDGSLPDHTPRQKLSTVEGGQDPSRDGSSRATAAKVLRFEDYVEQLSSELGVSPPPRRRDTPRAKSALANGYWSTNLPSSPPNFAPDAANAMQVSEAVGDDDGSASSDSDSGSSDDSSDADSSSSSSSASASGSDVEMDQPGAGLQDAPPRLLEVASSSDGSDSDESDSSSDSSSASSEYESSAAEESGSESDDDSSSQSSEDSDSSDSSSDLSSDSGSSVSVEGVRQPPGELPKKVPASVTAKPAHAKTKPPAAPGAAGPMMTRTQKRNARRRLLKAAKRAENAEGVPDAQPPNDTAETTDKVPPAPAPNDELLKRKEALLNSIGAASSSPVRADKGPAQTDSAPATTNAEETPASEKAPASAADNKKPAQRNSRIDLGAGRRLLFGALGLKAPKTKADEDKLRAELAKKIKAPADKRPEAQKSTADNTTTDQRVLEDEDPDAWRSKINYTAVECSQEGVELSQPPFPFVQRWDPQQRADNWYGKKGRGGKGKRKQRDQAHYYDDDERAGKKRRVSGPERDEEYQGFDDTFEMMEDTIMMQGVEEDQTGGAAEEDTAMDGGAGENEDDLPTAPEDMTSLPLLAPEEATPGMVITWKQWGELSTTQWQPALEDVTAVIVRVEQQPGSEPPTLHLLLAKRDRKVSKTKRYDPETGERIYEAFEAPDLDDSEDDDVEDVVDDGNRSLPFKELMEPRVVQLPLESQNMLGSGFMSHVRYDEEQPSEQLGGEAGETQGGSCLSMEPSVPMPTDPVGPEDATVQDSVPQPEDDGPGSQPAGNEDHTNGEPDSGITQPEQSGNITSNKTASAFSSVGSVASGRRQIDPHSLGADSMSMDFDDTVPDSVPFAQDLGTQINGGQGLQDGDDDDDDESDLPALEELTSSMQTAPQSAQKTPGEKIAWPSDNENPPEPEAAAEEEDSASDYEPSREDSEADFASEASEIDVNRQDEIRPAGGAESFFESAYAPSSPPARKAAAGKASGPGSGGNNKSKAGRTGTNGRGTKSPAPAPAPASSQTRRETRLASSQRSIANLKTEGGTSPKPSWLSQSSQRSGSVAPAPPQSQGGKSGGGRKKREKRKGPGKGFEVPMGSQVIELVSTPEPDDFEGQNQGQGQDRGQDRGRKKGQGKGQIGGLFVEQDEDVGAPLPKGPGWINKKKNRRF